MLAVDAMSVNLFARRSVKLPNNVINNYALGLHPETHCA
jgi:hypothetical protein